MADAPHGSCGPKSDNKRITAARIALLGLCNGLGEFDQSEAILSKIIDESDSVEENVYARSWERFLKRNIGETNQV